MTEQSIKTFFSQALKTILTLCFFGFPFFSFAAACDPANPIVPCDYETGTYTEYIGSNTGPDTASQILFYNNPDFDVTFQPTGSDWGPYWQFATSTATRLFYTCTSPGFVSCSAYPAITGASFWVDQNFVSSEYGLAEDYDTQILSLDPAHGSTTPSGNPVFFRARAWISEDPSFWDTIDISLRYNDENRVLSELTQFYEVELYSGAATTTGIFDFSTTTILADGNYTVIFSLRNSTAGGVLPNPFGGDSQELRHQFIVGSSTYLGQINQNLISDLNTIFASSTATSTAALLAACAPWDWGGFSIKDCLSGLLIPDTATMYSITNDFKNQIMQKAPWGYATRLFAIVSGTGTSTPPALVFTIPDDPYFSAGLRNKSITFNPWNAVAAGSILDEADGFGQGNLMNTFMPYWKIIVYGLMIFGLVHRIMGMNSRRSASIQKNAPFSQAKEYYIMKENMGGGITKIRRFNQNK